MSAERERSHYQALGIAEDASLEEIRRAHRQLARVLHPDRTLGVPPAEQQLAQRRMREVNAAWTVLSDNDRRREYDRSLALRRIDLTAGAQRSAAAGAGGRAGSAGSTSGSAATRPGAAAGGPAGAGQRGDSWQSHWDLDPDPDEPPVSEVHFWLLRRGPVIAAIVLAVGIFVFTAYAGGGSRESTTTTPAEDCVRVPNPPDAVRTSCALPNDGRIVTTVPVALDCPEGTRYVLIDGTFTCIRGAAGRPDGPAS
jgi:hypothetical protein